MHHHHPSHDHELCIDAAIARAADLCAERGVKFTELRRLVLSLIWSGHRPRGAYSLIEDMAQQGRRVAPLTIYRTLDFLVTQGFVHRIESLNAFIGCPEPGSGHSGQFLVCQECGDATEMDDPAISQAVVAGAKANGFAAARQMIEVLGRCRNCAA